MACWAGGLKSLPEILFFVVKVVFICFSAPPHYWHDCFAHQVSILDLNDGQLCGDLSFLSSVFAVFSERKMDRKRASIAMHHHIFFSWTGYISSLQIHWIMKPLAVHQSTHIFSLFVFYIKFGPFVAFFHNCKQGKAHKRGGRQHVIQPVGSHPWYLATKKSGFR